MMYKMLGLPLREVMSCSSNVQPNASRCSKLNSRLHVGGGLGDNDVCRIARTRAREIGSRSTCIVIVVACRWLGKMPRRIGESRCYRGASSLVVLRPVRVAYGAGRNRLDQAA